MKIRLNGNRRKFIHVLTVILRTIYIAIYTHGISLSIIDGMLAETVLEGAHK
jgi:hypothetical protein